MVLENSLATNNLGSKSPAAAHENLNFLKAADTTTVGRSRCHSDPLQERDHHGATDPLQPQERSRAALSIQYLSPVQQHHHERIIEKPGGLKTHIRAQSLISELGPLHRPIYSHIS